MNVENQWATMQFPWMRLYPKLSTDVPKISFASPLMPEQQHDQIIQDILKNAYDTSNRMLSFEMPRAITSAPFAPFATTETRTMKTTIFEFPPQAEMRLGELRLTEKKDIDQLPQPLTHRKPNFNRLIALTKEMLCYAQTETLITIFSMREKSFGAKSTFTEHRTAIYDMTGNPSENQMASVTAEGQFLVWQILTSQSGEIRTTVQMKYNFCPVASEPFISQKIHWKSKISLVTFSQNRASYFVIQPDTTLPLCKQHDFSSKISCLTTGAQQPYTYLSLENGEIIVFSFETSQQLSCVKPSETFIANNILMMDRSNLELIKDDSVALIATSKQGTLQVLTATQGKELRIEQSCQTQPSAFGNDDTQEIFSSELRDSFIFLGVRDRRGTSIRIAKIEKNAERLSYNYMFDIEGTRDLNSFLVCVDGTNVYKQLMGFRAAGQPDKPANDVPVSNFKAFFTLKNQLIDVYFVEESKFTSEFASRYSQMMTTSTSMESTQVQRKPMNLMQKIELEDKSEIVIEGPDGPKKPVKLIRRKKGQQNIVLPGKKARDQPPVSDKITTIIVSRGSTHDSPRKAHAKPSLIPTASNHLAAQAQTLQSVTGPGERAKMLPVSNNPVEELEIGEIPRKQLRTAEADKPVMPIKKYESSLGGLPASQSNNVTQSTTLVPAFDEALVNAAVQNVMSRYEKKIVERVNSRIEVMEQGIKNGVVRELEGLFKDNQLTDSFTRRATSNFDDAINGIVKTSEAKPVDNEMMKEVDNAVEYVLGFSSNLDEALQPIQNHLHAHCQNLETVSNLVTNQNAFAYETTISEVLAREQQFLRFLQQFNEILNVTQGELETNIDTIVKAKLQLTAEIGEFHRSRSVGPELRSPEQQITSAKTPSLPKWQSGNVTRDNPSNASPPNVTNYTKELYSHSGNSDGYHREGTMRQSERGAGGGGNEFKWSGSGRWQGEDGGSGHRSSSKRDWSRDDRSGHDNSRQPSHEYRQYRRNGGGGGSGNRSDRRDDGGGGTGGGGGGGYRNNVNRQGKNYAPQYDRNMTSNNKHS